MSQETKKEEWEGEFEDLWDEQTGGEYIPTFIYPFIRSLLTSHDAELARKIEGMLPVAGVRNGAWLIEEDAVLALLGKKNV